MKGGVRLSRSRYVARGAGEAQVRRTRHAALRGPATVDLVFGKGDNRRRVWRRSSPGAASEKMPLRLVLGPEGGRGAGASRRVEPTRVFRSPRP
jgi:hypothetical protein